MTQDMKVYGKFTDIYSYVKELCLFMAFMAIGGLGAWADDYSGTYYLAFPGKVNTPSLGYNADTPANNYYLCPTEGYLYFQGTNQCTTSDNGQPFLTTYQCRNSGYDSEKAQWTLIKHTIGQQDYYYIRHTLDGKYLVYNARISGAGENRLRVHLESVPMPEENENALFKITTDNSGAHFISAYNDNTVWLNLTEGNFPYLHGTNAKTDGPSSNPNVGGTLGRWKEANNTGQVFFEPVPVAPPAMTVHADGSLSMSAAGGTTIYYTTDGTNPRTSPTRITYTSTISASVIANIAGTAIQAYAVDNTDNTQVSIVVSQPLAIYTYKIVNQSNQIATNYAIKEAIGKPLNGIVSIPSAIQSSYLSDETITYYSFDGHEAIGAELSHATLESHDPITQAPGIGSNIYVAYTTTNVGSKFLSLTNTRPYNITSAGQYFYDNGGAFGADGVYDADKMVNKSYLWYLTGSDPYHVKVQNVGSNQFLHHTSPTFSLDDTSQTFILQATTTVNATTADVTLTNHDVTETFTIRINTVVLPLNFTLIDKQGKLIESGIRYSESEGFNLPAAWRSPLVSAYKYYKHATIDGDHYSVSEDDRITGLDGLGDKTDIYVTYDVDHTRLDLDGRNSLNISNKTGKSYKLKFLTPDTEPYKFYQEEADDVMSTKRRAIYPYNNGDGALYVYGEEKWQEDLSAGASTRTRWLWYIEPANHPSSVDELDPYHVKISSFQAHTSYQIDDDHTRDFHSYLKTYQPAGHTAIITTVTSDNPLAHGGAASDAPNSSDATEYMILGTSLNSVKLLTFQGIEGASSTADYGTRQTVHSFEHYWKTYETVSHKGLYNYNPPVNNPSFTDRGITLHHYPMWAYARPITPSSPTVQNAKKFEQTDHWFQTVEMGENLTFVETALDPMLILLDRHGWEIARIKLPSGPNDPNRAARYADIHRYSSPMVARYHFWKTARKIPGYHKYTVSDYATVSHTDLTEYTADELGRADLSNSTPNLPNFETQAFVAGQERDWYVTYDVKPEYANAYAGAATRAATTASRYLVRQGDEYAKTDGTTLTTISSLPETIGNDIQWYLRPNFDIDEEMGYQYDVEETPVAGEPYIPNKTQTEAAYYAAGKNDFDPYNIQIQSVANENRYLTTNTSNSRLSNSWSGSSSNISLQTLGVKQEGVVGHDQTILRITNTTFMIVNDDRGNMVLMPRFDHSHVVNSFTTPQFVNTGSSTNHLTISPVPTIVNNSSEIKAMGGYYILAENFTVNSSVGTADKPFMGTIDGQLHTFKFSAPLVAYAKDATIKNIILQDVQISGSGSVGAICRTANGKTRIFNCGILPVNPSFSNETSTVGSTDGYCGSIVGELNGNARVVNCYSYATITGGSTVAGIVGYIGSTAITQANIDDVPMVVNCMFYGEITGGATKYPVYGGAMIRNDETTGKGVNPYNYFRKTANFDENFGNIDHYNRSWPAEEKNLTRFEYYRSLLNSNRNLCTYWITNKAYSRQTNDDRALMAKWVLDASIAPYPVLKERGYYPSVINLDTEYRINPETKAKEPRSAAPEWQGHSYGTLSVTIKGGANNSSAADVIRNITITDMDTLNCDYGYYKIQLPYYNHVFGNPKGTTWAEKYGNNYTNKVVTGWMITSITGGTPGTFTADWETGYNFADRNCTNKDLYGTGGSNRVFAQGGYYYVPAGVTAITIEAYWGHAVYLANRGRSIDRVNLTDAGYKADKPFAPAGTMADEFQGETVYDDLQTAIMALGSAATVYDQAIVLIGNHQVKNGNNSVGYSLDKKWHPFTIMSADLDYDCEPDYCLQLQFRHDISRPGIQPVRFDFLPVVELGLAVRHNKNAYAIGIFVPQGHFEVTETAFMRTTQFEYDGPKDDNNRVDGKSPVIINGGEFELFNVRYHDADRTSYFLLGGKAWVHRFAPGAHPNMGSSPKTKLCAVNAIGGEYPEFYLSGIYRPDIATPDNQGSPHCYTNGGKFGTMAGAGYDKVAGGVTFKINHSLINEFYGGGINGSNPVGGNIDVTIDYSHVQKYCGGPKVGNMTGKTVTTHATGTTFGVYYGAGNGGNNYYRQLQDDGDKPSNHIGTWTDSKYNWNGFSPVKNTFDAGTDNKGYHAEYEFEVFNQSNGVADQITQRGFIRWIQFGLTTTGNVESTLTNCIVNTNFYGGGNLANVNGNITSTLENTTVAGNAFGGGYSATIPTFSVHDKDNATLPSMDYAGTISDGVIPYKTEDGKVIVYEWTNDLNGATEANRRKSPTYKKDGKWYCYTWNSLENLGAVTGNVTLNITGNTLVKGEIYDEEGHVTDHAGVFGGGDASKVIGNTVVTMNASGQKSEGYNALNVYGGGNTADVQGSTTVTLEAGIVSQDIFGGGKGASTTVTDDVVVNIGTKEGTTYSGTGTAHDVYGGSALGAVNATKGSNGGLSATAGKTTTVNVYAGTISGSIFGGGLGSVEESHAALNFGNTTVTMEGGTVQTAIYGGSHANGVLKGTSTVTITGGTVGTEHESDGTTGNVVFGGGFGEPTLVEDSVHVNIGTPTQTTDGATIHGNIYGGGALGSVNASKPAETLIFNTTKGTEVSLYRGTIVGNVFGGGLGKKASENNDEVLAYVGGDVNVLLDGAKLTTIRNGEAPLTGQIFGGNNLNGTPKGHIKVHVKRTVGSEKPAAVTRDDRTTYDVAAVYGGGNQADYRPTDAELNPNEAGKEAENRAKIAAATAEVVIEGCDQTSIEYVYGGGNAAAVPATDVTILGTYIIDHVFGGGNGKGTGNPGANVGLRNNGTEEYGSGKAVTKLVGGHMHYVFGGSNTLGNVRGGTSISMPDKEGYEANYDCCNVRDIKEIYGAGNEAEQDGPVTMILGCVDNMDYVFGGARNAHVKGGVDLVVTSGHFKGVFGGNDTSGSVQGPITLTIEETGCDPLIIDNLYLGGKDAAYSVYGYKNTSGTLTARTMAEYEALTAEERAAEGLPYAAPVLNVISCTSIGNVFGGGLGSNAVMFANPTVNINMIPGSHADLMDRDGNGTADGDATLLGTVGNVYGGGSAANVVGATRVNICTEDSVTVRSDMGAQISSPTAIKVQGAIITGNVFGAGLGLETVVDSTTIVMAGGSVAKSIYGGGEEGSVNGNTNIIIRGGTIGSEGLGAEIYGNVYGGGKGTIDLAIDSDNVRAGLVKGNTHITIEDAVADAAYAAAHDGVAEGDILRSPVIYHNIYGGGAHGSVGSYTYKADNTIDSYTSGGKATITITGGTIGTDGVDNGMVYGASRGDVGTPGSIHDKVAWVYDTEVTIGTTTGGAGNAKPSVRGSVYGSGENGHTYHDASVVIHGGTIGINEGEDVTYYDANHAVVYTGKDYNYPYRGNVYGGGCGTDMYDADNNGTDDAYNRQAGIVGGRATTLIDGGHITRNVYGAGAMGSVTGATDVTVAGNAIIGIDGSEGGLVFAAARGEAGMPEFATVGSTSLTIGGNSTIWGSAFGGGQNGFVHGAVAVNLTSGTIKHDVYGGGALAETNTDYHATNHPDYTTTVTLAGATIVGDLYGGGLGSHAVAANVNGPVTVNVTDGKVTNVFGCNNLNGAPKESASVNITGTAFIDGQSTIANVYGGGNQAAYEGNTYVSVSGGTIDYVYGGGLGASAKVTGNTSVTIAETATSCPTIAQNVYGGGSMADVTGNVNVTISGGKVINDVYGGGALAETNTGNWTPGLKNIYMVVVGLATENYIEKTDIVPGSSSVSGLYTRSGSEGNYTYTLATGTAATGTTYYEKVPASSLKGLYTRSGTEGNYTYTEITTDDTYSGTGEYYELRSLPGDWTAGMNNAATGTTYKTTVTLTGGVIGNVYGGGLGRLAKEGVAPVGEEGTEGYVPGIPEITPITANVYGDVKVLINKPSDMSEHGGQGVAFTHRTEDVVTTSNTTYTAVPVTGRVFGCNNLNGCPLGDVLVEVYSTRQIDANGNRVAGHKNYEIQAVYGGGDQADYLPAENKKTQVIIYGCEESSISRVYGGGNSAAVPATDVVIWGSYDIEYAFGGGNGSQPIKKNGNWVDNTGANVNGSAKITCHGGKIGQVFGGSDAKGNCRSTNPTLEQSGACPLVITKLYGAGSEADVDGDVNVVIAACTETNSQIEYVCGGSYKAHISGDVHLTITAGYFKNVYGGNDQRGGIGGNIIVDIEETDPCSKPIIIENLVGGGNQAKYPGTDKSGNAFVIDPNNPRTITVNVKSATRIDNVYGGSFIEEATANTKVNINMVKGGKHGTTGVLLPSDWDKYSKPDGGRYYNVSNIRTNYVEKNISEGASVVGYYTSSGTGYVAATGTAANGITYYEKQVTGNIADSIGTIGNVYGGGQHGKVDGNTEVNIVTSPTVQIMQRHAETHEIVATRNESGNIISIAYEDQDALGVNITGNVYGGGEMADVTGNTQVNICAKESATQGIFNAVAVGNEGVRIAGHVFGGGKGAADSFTCAKAMVGEDGTNIEGHEDSSKGTNVRIGNGTIGGAVYGGGMIGRVEWHTAVTVGLTPESGTSAPVIEGNVFGAGKGVITHGYSALVRGNTAVTIQQNAKVKKNVYGGGEYASVGKYNVKRGPNNPVGAPDWVSDGMPYSLANSNSGNCTIVIRDNAIVGPDTPMAMPTFLGNVFGAGKGSLPYEGINANETPWRETIGNVIEYYNVATFGEQYVDKYLEYIESLGLATQTSVTIDGNAFIKGSVYGGSENGHVQHDTRVTIQGACQIGCGKNTTERHPDEVWNNNYEPSTNLECASWEYHTPFAPYDKFTQPTATDGHTYYGNVFGGGSGKDPYASGKWHREAGSVGGNTYVDIKGGHILTSVYGGNEHTDVGSYDRERNLIEGTGHCTVTMSGGSLGVPRTLEQIAAHPVTCYMFGAGKGDQRVLFNTWTNVGSTNVTVNGGTIYGSVFGGGEDGHILGNDTVNIGGTAKIGTWGTSYVDGNIFGGGRGFSGDAQTAGTVGGNVSMNISGGLILGSVYGGGRLASIGTHFTSPDANEYGQLMEDEDGHTHGYVTVNITGGTIGKAGVTGAGAEHSGNVFGGSMGRETLLNGEINPIWPELAQSKFSTVNISGNDTHITRNVYGGGEYGVVRENATVTIEGGTIDGSVFGGGKGSDDHQHPTTIDVHWGGTTAYYTYTPMQWAGCVGGNTTVNISGGTIKDVYGGGELASVGVIDYSVEEKAGGDFTFKGKTYSYKNIVKHTDPDNGFALSWPYEFTYVPCNPTGFIGGLATVNITNGTISEYVFGGGKGKVAYHATEDITQQRYNEAYCANVRRTQVIVGTPGGTASTPTIGTSVNGSVYGGGEDGHVLEDASVTIHHGTVSHSVFGGGKGTSTYTTTLWDTEHPGSLRDTTDLTHSWTAGKVYGNTTVTLNGGQVGWFIYGGGNMGSVGKGNYAGGSDDYSTAGYGEKATSALWTSSFNSDAEMSESNKPDDAYHFLHSGKATVNLYGGSVGSESAGFNSDGIPYGSVFGGSRGIAAMDVGALSPRYKYVPDFFLGYVNKTVINVGDTTKIGNANYTGPTLYGSIYGGGQDGHVRNNTEVKIYKGNIVGQANDTHGRSGHIFGAGSGIGTYLDNKDHQYKISSSSGSVTCTTLVEVNDGSIHGNIWGGGAMASVGPPRTGQSYNEYHSPTSEHKSFSHTLVNIKGGSIGGSVYGAGRGPSDMFYEQQFVDKAITYDKTKFATDIWSDVNIIGGTIGGSVYGGGEGGIVKENTVVHLTGGNIDNDAFGGGRGTAHIAADVNGDTYVELNNNNNDADADGSKPGCSVRRIFGCNDLNGTPKGHVKVHVYATQHPDRTAHAIISSKVEEPSTNPALDADYDVQAVYGGGNLAPYEPTVNEDRTEVIIEGCDVTSIKQVYGGGNAASVPATDVLVKSCYIIDELFGGGNGYDDYQIGSTYYDNPGANVGYRNFTHVVEVSDDGYVNVATNGDGSENAPYLAIDNADATSPDDRRAHYVYGTGVATTVVNGGRIHSAYGGSNEKGNISGEISTLFKQVGTCPMDITTSYGGSKTADTDATINVLLDCVENGGTKFGGSYKANIYSDINLRITNGKYDKIFGGNDRAGTINGKITIDIVEDGCTPIEIGSLYGGGFLAPYSVYGYKKDASGNYIEERAKDENGHEYMDGNSYVMQRVPAKPGDTGALATPYRHPQINIISATRIDSIFGGGYKALMIGSPHINVNMTNGIIRAEHKDYKAEYATLYDSLDAAGNRVIPIGTIGTIYGGGNLADVQGDTHVEIGTGTHHNDLGEEVTITPARNAATITGNVFGGGKGETKESGEGAFTCPVAMIGEDGKDYGSTSVTIANGEVRGSVYGGGEIGRVEKNTVVTIGKEKDKENEAIITGHVFGAGKGVETHGYSALVRGNSTVTIQGQSKVKGSVYGGGQTASVGRYTVVNGRPTSLANQNSGYCTITIRDDAEIGPDDMVMTRAEGPDDAGHVFGGGKGVTPGMYSYAGNDKPWNVTKTSPTDTGTKITYNNDDDYLSYLETLGLSTQTVVTIGGNAFVKGSVYGGAENGYVQHDTYVKIEDDCQIGNGYVQMADDGTYLAEADRYSLNRRYTAKEWADGRLYEDGETNYTSSLPECASWPYGKKIVYGNNETFIYAPYDKFALTTAGMEEKYEDGTSSGGGRRMASDGHTFYGNVFGGGSGYYPYKPGKWHHEAGSVGGSTLVEITGGHILSNVYGGNEMTDVLGDSCRIIFGDSATLGVPRTIGQIVAHPVTCYMFGAGMGDTRTFFNKYTNVSNVGIDIYGGTIYGSVFGGGEDGHVIRNVNMTIREAEGNTTRIGTWGTSYVDGNVFGAGRGFTGDAYTAGNVGGSVTMNIMGGTMLGSIYGGGRLGSVGYGLYKDNEEGYGEMLDDDKMDDGSTAPDGWFPKGRGHVEINISGGTIGNDFEYKYVPTTVSDLTAWKGTHNVPSTDYETTSSTSGETTTYTHRLNHTRGGNVYTGGMGRREKLNGDVINYPNIDWHNLGNVKSTKLNISGGHIKSNVYGGGEFGAVRGYHLNGTERLSTEINITGGIIGTDIVDESAEGETKPVIYTFGSVYGGGTGTIIDVTTDTPVSDAKMLSAYVTDSTKVSITDAIVKASVYGGGELGAVGGSTHVSIAGNSEIGRNEVRPVDDANAGYVMFGSWRMGNVYGGGRGSEQATIAGLVKGNTNININGGNIYHMVYGGGALASVGTFSLSGGDDTPSYIPISGVPYNWTANTGTANVTITGGTIGISGRDNGLVFGSSRGNLAKPVNGIDIYDRLAWVNNTVVTIGTAGSTDLTSPHIKGSLFGGGENGHNNGNATVNVYSGTIGIADTTDTWYSFQDKTLERRAQSNRGNVYGAGSGSDTYTGNDGKEHYNARSGMVGGNTFVNITGGHVGRSVYGGGAMASVGTVINDTTGVNKHISDANSFALSWPYKFVFADNTGKATVNVTGGHFGIRQIDGGDIYGSSRGEAGDRYSTAHLAYVKETEVNVTYPETAEMPNEDTIQNDFTIPCVTGSVHGSGEDGYVYGDAHVTLNKGLIGHSIYGAGKGKGTYKVDLVKIGATPKPKVNESDPDEYDDDDYYKADIYSLISGRVMGNTFVTMNGGRVGRNIYGGGNMGSVGKGNFACGTDDYYTGGYGEKIGTPLWTNASEGNDAWEFLNSGKTTVRVVGGMVGYVNAANPNKSVKDNLPYGNVFGGSTGEAAPNVPASLTPRYLYCPSFFSGYVNETDVTIGTAGQSSEDAGQEGKAPLILGSVYGGGQDGHVRRDTKVTVNSGEIGLAHNQANRELLQTSVLDMNEELDNPQWLHRGNVYGAGSGISRYQFDFNNDQDFKDSVVIGGRKYIEEDYSTSAGSVTRFTQVDVNGGIIHRNVYGGGSMAAVGAPPIPPTRKDTPDKLGDTTEGHGPGWQSTCTVNIAGAVGTPSDYVTRYGGSVYGASRGISEESDFGSVIWTRVIVWDGAKIMGNVFGGGDAGMVKRDTEVRIGEK